MTAAPEHHHSGDGSDGNGVHGTHTESEDHAWSITIPDHPARTESEGFRRSKEAAHKILAAVAQDSSAPASLVKSISH